MTRRTKVSLAPVLAVIVGGAVAAPAVALSEPRDADANRDTDRDGVPHGDPRGRDDGR